MKESGGESSVPLSSRVDMKVLAELDKYWMSQGYTIRTMSQLVSWSLGLLCQVLESNEKVSAVESVREANEWLVGRNLYQATTRKRGFMKIGSALRFESMREEGVDPREVAPEQFNTVNRKNSVQPMPKEAGPAPGSGYQSPFEADYEKARIEAAKNELSEIEKSKREIIERAIKSGVIRQSNVIKIDETKASANLTTWEAEKREKEIVEKENAPIDWDFLKDKLVDDPDKK